MSNLSAFYLTGNEFRDQPAQIPSDPAVALLGNHPQGIGLDFVGNRAWVRDRSALANNKLGAIEDVLTSLSPSPKVIRLSSGLLEEGPNTRLNYDANGDPLGLLIEPQTTRLNRYPTQFSNGYWAKHATRVVTPNAAIAPDGTMTADLVTANSGTDVRFSLIGSGSGPVYTNGGIVAESWLHSCFFKPNGVTTIALGAWNAAVRFNWLTYNLDTDVTTPYRISNPGFASFHSIEEFPNGWFRLSVLHQSEVTTVWSFVPVIHFGNGDGLALRNNSVDDGGGVYIWGHNVVAGNQLSSVILGDETAQVTRALDQVGVSISAFPYNAGAGAWEINGSIASPSVVSDVLCLPLGQNQTLKWIPS